MFFINQLTLYLSWQEYHCINNNLFIATYYCSSTDFLPGSSLSSVDAASVADVSQVHGASFFRVKVSRVRQETLSMKQAAKRQHVFLKCWQHCPYPHTVRTQGPHQQ